MVRLLFLCQDCNYYEVRDADYTVTDCPSCNGKVALWAEKVINCDLEKGFVE